jgi:DNA polymerase-3 subunit delta
MRFEEIIADLRKKIYHPVYFLMGEEPYYLDQISNYIEENVLNEAEKGFNQTVVYGRDTSLAELVGMARRFPMMANYQVIIVKEAQDLFRKNELEKINQVIKAKEALDAPKAKRWVEAIREHRLQSVAQAMKVPDLCKPSDKKVLEEVFAHLALLNSESGKAYAGLIQLLDQPMKSSILVFNYKYQKLDKRKAFAKKLDKAGVLFESARLYDNKIPDWIVGWLQKKGYSIDIPAAALLAEYLGTDLSRVANELGKLIINLPAGTRVNATHIEENIGISKEYNIFELQKALGARDRVKALRIVNYFAANEKENPVVKTIFILHSYFSKLLLYHSLKDRSQNNVAAALGVNPFFVKDYQQAASGYPSGRLQHILGLLYAYDLKAKGVNNISAGDGELTRELVFRIL